MTFPCPRKCTLRACAVYLLFTPNLTLEKSNLLRQAPSFPAPAVTSIIYMRTRVRAQRAHRGIAYRDLSFLDEGTAIIIIIDGR